MEFASGDRACFGRRAVMAEPFSNAGSTSDVEPASSRLIKKTGYAKPNLNQTPAEETLKGITEFTSRHDNLPHWQLPGAFYFMTFKTKDHRVLSDQSKTIAANSLRHWHGTRLQLIAAAVMPDHVHAVIQPLEKSKGVYWDLADLLHSIKSFSASEINKTEAKTGEPVWQTETYDRIIRDEKELNFVLQYMSWNPVKEGLCNHPDEYKWLILGDAVKEAGWKPAPREKSNYTV
jgi:REP element-mobilizing transposase RayT